MLLYMSLLMASMLAALILISLMRSMRAHRSVPVAGKHARGARNRQIRSPSKFSGDWRDWFTGFRGGKAIADARRGNQPLHKPWGW